MNIEKKIPLITCPVCGQTYVPGEIFMPESFFGNQKEIIKNEQGKIEFYTGDDMDLEEEYVCDSCMTKLKIKANLTFDVVPEEKFDEEYVSEINKPAKIKLKETDLFND